MRYYALATDYDDTLAEHGRADAQVYDALRALRDSGRKLILVTGRNLDELLPLVPEPAIFDRIVAENGALLHNPVSGETALLAEPPPPRLVEVLHSRNVTPIAEGRVIVATREPHEKTVLEAIQELGIEFQVIFNKGAVMVLPSGVNKATGLKAALKQLELSPHNVVAVGDAENDHALLAFAGLGAAVGNALPSLKEHADYVARADRGEGVAELIHLLVSSEEKLTPKQGKNAVQLGVGAAGQPVLVSAYGTSILLAGTSGGGKSTLVTGFIEVLLQRQFQACIIDPEGDYPELDGCMVLGDGNRTASSDEVINSLQKPEASVVVNLMAVRMADRPAYFQKLLTSLLELRSRTGRPHWIIIDEAHHVIPAGWKPALQILPSSLKGTFSVTVQPDHVATEFLEKVDLVLAIGKEPARTIREFSSAVGREMPAMLPESLPTGQAVGWWTSGKEPPVTFNAMPMKTLRRRHVRKYMRGELAPEESFYFRGPDGKLSLRAQNLALFMQLAEGIDDETWLFHLKNGDYSRWFETCIKDEDLSRAATVVEQEVVASAEESKQKITQAIQERYTAPA